MGNTTLIDTRKGRPPSGGSDAPPPDGEPVVLYARRKQIYPQLVFGAFRNIKWALLGLTLAIYYILPWLRWDRGPGAPDQAVLADFAGGRFYFFGIEIWPQEVYYITGLLILAAVGLFLVTALLGRVWCGYFCPQTVWTDLFLVVERFFEGDR
ncbi:MAG: 4Fe-4S binding protein, partial [Burkholderiales bacterium]